MGFKKLAVISSTAAMLFSAAVIATPIYDETGTIYQATSVSDFNNHLHLDGMQVTACFTTGDCELVTFNGASAGATGTGWSLTLHGDTFLYPFLFSTDIPVISLTLDGLNANSVFDIKPRGEVGTPGSAEGTPYSIHEDFYDNDDQSGWAEFAALSVTYSNEVWLNGHFYGDLYSQMSLLFSDNGVTGNMSFYTDTDSVTFAVPAPATLFLMVFGVAGLGLSRRLTSRQRS